MTSNLSAIRDLPLRPRGFPIVDADSHVVETDRTWDYLEPAEQRYRPQLFVSSAAPAMQYWIIDGKIGGFRFPTLTERERATMSEARGRSLLAGAAARGLDDVGMRLDELDQLGIDFQVVHNTLWIEQLTDRPQIEGALCRSWNRWMVDLISQSEGRLFWSCVVPVLDAESAVEELRFARSCGAVAVCVRPFERNRLVTDPSFHWLFDEAQSLDMTVIIHIGNGSQRLVSLLGGGHSSMGGWAPFRVPAVIAAHSLLASGIAKTFPALRWGVIEASASWVPWVRAELARDGGGTRRGDPDPFMENNVWVSAQGDDDLPYLTGFVSPERLVVGTDFGHSDTATELGVHERVLASPALSEELKARFLCRNAVELFNLRDAVQGSGSESEAPGRLLPFKGVRRDVEAEVPWINRGGPTR